MEEAKTLSHIQTYPMVYIKKEDLDDEIKDERGHFIGHKTFDQDGNVIPIICARAPHQTQIFLKDIVASVTKDDRLELGFNIYDNYPNQYSGYMNKTREDEKIVLVYTFTSGENKDQYGTLQAMGVSFITNYGNIVSGILYRDSVLGSMLSRVQHVSSFRYDAPGGVSISGPQTGNGARINMSVSAGVKEFIYKPFPERQCYVPQLFVDVIATFLQYTNRKCVGYTNAINEDINIKEADKLLQKFKELCYNYNTKSVIETEVKHQIEYAPEIPVKMTYPVIQIEYKSEYNRGRAHSVGFTEQLTFELTEFGGDGDTTTEIFPRNLFAFKTKEDEKVVFIHILDGRGRQYSYRNGSGTEGTFNYIIITNYGFIHKGYIVPGRFARSDQHMGSFSGGEPTPTLKTIVYKDFVKMEFIDIYHQSRSESVRLIPNTLPDYPKVPKLFVDVLSSVLNKDQEKFHKLCGEYTAPPPNEELKEINEILQEEKEKLIEENRLLREKIENTQLKELNEKIIKKLRECEKQNEKLNKELILANQTIDRFENKNEELTEILIQKSDELKELKEELFGLKSFYNLPLAFRFRR